MYFTEKKKKILKGFYSFSTQKGVKFKYDKLKTYKIRKLA